jgi:peptidyl-prolyl cis-trans isomerase D
MALLGKIRSYGVLMMVLIIVAVFGFLFMDVSSVGRGFGGPSRVLGSIGGSNISRDELESYVNMYEQMGAKNDEQTRDFAWKEVVKDVIFKIQSNKLGIKISDKELEDMFSGENISPVVMEMMGGQADRAALEQQRSSYIQVKEKAASELNQNERDYLETWKNIEKRAVSERITSKYLNLIAKSNYAPSWMTNAEFTRNNRTYDFNYVRILYSDLPNNEVKVSDADLTAYIKENSKKYQREANVSLEYVLFDVLPTSKDSSKYLERMTKVASDFAVAENDTTFVTNNRGKLDFKYLTKSDMTEPESIKDSLFSRSKGAVVGPYIDNEGNYKVVKIVDTKLLPDSVKCRHIFRAANSRDMSALQQSYGLLDSLKKLVVDKKISFDSLVAQNTMDMESAARGGDIGWRKKGDVFGENFVDFIYHVGKKDSFEIIQTTQGLHLIQITDSRIGKDKGLKLASVLEPIIPSTETEDIVEAKANEFMANNRKLADLQKSAKKSTLKTMTATGLQINDFRINEQISGTVATEIIRWAHKEAKKTEVAGQVYPVSDPSGNFVSQIIIPALVSKSAKGLATIEDIGIKQEVETIVRNKKKAELISAKLKGVNSLDAVVQKYSSAKVETANAVAYSSPFVPGIGIEPKVIGAAEALQVNKVSEPIAGNQAVYVIQLVNKIEGPAMDNISIARKSISDRMLPPQTTQLRDVISEALKDVLKLKDNRADSY